MFVQQRLKALHLQTSSPSRRNVSDLVNQSHDKKLGRLRMQAITQTADDGMYVITIEVVRRCPESRKK